MLSLIMKSVLIPQWPKKSSLPPFHDILYIILDDDPVRVHKHLTIKPKIYVHKLQTQSIIIH